MKPIAYIYTDLPEKFGVPRQSGLVQELTGRIVFEPEYRNADAVSGLCEFEYIWLLWRFDGVESDEFRPLVRPPRLGGNEKRGVFATRSPFRPNPIGLSSLKLLKVCMEQEGPVIYVSGSDMRDRTAIYDIKPYIPFTDSHPEAKAGFVDSRPWEELEVVCKEELLCVVPPEKRTGLLKLLAQDPRPAYQEDTNRIYGLSFGELNVRFRVGGSVLTVLEIQPK